MYPNKLMSKKSFGGKKINVHRYWVSMILIHFFIRLSMSSTNSSWQISSEWRMQRKTQSQWDMHPIQPRLHIFWDKMSAFIIKLSIQTAFQFDRWSGLSLQIKLFRSSPNFWRMKSLRAFAFFSFLRLHAGKKVGFFCYCVEMLSLCRDILQGKFSIQHYLQCIFHLKRPANG